MKEAIMAQREQFATDNCKYFIGKRLYARFSK